MGTHYMKKNKSDSQVFESFLDLSEAALFYLQESFIHIELGIQYSIASVIYKNKLDKIDATEEDKNIVANLDEPIDNPLQILKSNKNPITDETIFNLTQGWIEAQKEARSANLKFPVKHEISGRRLLGHVTNFAFLIEVVINRHLIIMNLEKEIDDFTFNSLDKASVLNKVIYLFKDEIKNKEFNPQKIGSLFKLRNLAVHFTRDTSQKLKTTVEELINIWNESEKIIGIINKKESIKEQNLYLLLNEQKESFVSKYVLKKGSANS